MTTLPKTSALRPGFRRLASGAIAGVLRSRDTVAWQCPHEHRAVGEAYRCADAELVRRELMEIGR